MSEAVGTLPEVENLFRIGPTSFEALGDRVLVLVDQFKSGYECEICGGKQKVKCMDCVAGRSAINPNMLCKTCHGTTEMVCPDCEGKGVEKGGIVVPDSSQNRPESGTIVSIGEDVGRPVRRIFGVRVQATDERKQILKLGDKVLFGRFAGNSIDLETVTKDKIFLRILNESEVLCRLQGQLELRRLKKSSKEEVV